MSDAQSQPYTIPYFIKYNPALKAEFGSQNAVLLFDRLEYWFAKSKDQFYKFIEPCNHPLYKIGDSFAEELGFSHKVFRTAFDKIGVRYRSKTEFEKEDNPFKGKFFAYYQDRQTKKTIFVRNNSLVKDLYLRLKALLAHASAKLVKPVKSTFSSFKKGRPTDSPLGRPYADATKDKQITTSFKKEDLILGEEEKDDSLGSSMVDIWKEEIGRRGLIPSTPENLHRLEGALKDLFQGSLDLWRAHCVKIASSQFLMGEKQGTNYEIRMLVAISKPFNAHLSEGKYELKTRKTNHDQRIQELNDKLHRISVSQELVETEVSRLEDERKSAERKAIAEKAGVLSASELKELEDHYAKKMAVSSCTQGHNFRAGGWEGPMVRFMFDLFVEKKIKETMTLSEESFSKKVCYVLEKKDQLKDLYQKTLESLRWARSFQKC